jgi:hypothetical protein
VLQQSFAVETNVVDGRWKKFHIKLVTEIMKTTPFTFDIHLVVKVVAVSLFWVVRVMSNDVEVCWLSVPPMSSLLRPHYVFVLIFWL